MSRSIVVDACVAYKWFSDLDEDSVEEAEALLDAYEAGDTDLIAPATITVEVANALRNSRFSREKAIILIGEFELFHVEVHEPTTVRLQRAAELAYLHDLSVYNALYLALAEELDCPLVTADRKAFGRIDTSVEIRLL